MDFLRNESLNAELMESFDENSLDDSLKSIHSDDSSDFSLLELRVSALMDTMVNLGGEVCRMRSEVDELLEQNETLLASFKKLREVIVEKGSLDMDDFELACDVMNHGNAGFQLQPVKKYSH